MIKIQIIAPTGEGKTTIANFLAGALKQAGVNVTLKDDEENLERPLDILAGRKVEIKTIQTTRDAERVRGWYD